MDTSAHTVGGGTASERTESPQLPACKILMSLQWTKFEGIPKKKTTKKNQPLECPNTARRVKGAIKIQCFQVSGFSVMTIGAHATVG